MTQSSEWLGDVDQRTARDKLASLHRLLGSLGSAVVAFSGGADSAFLAFMTHQALGEQALAVTADSPSLPRAELEAAKVFASEHGLRHQIVSTDELRSERYVQNQGDRCYFCKQALMDALSSIRAALRCESVLVGVNQDDFTDHRPGQQAVLEQGGRWPLAEVGLSKSEIRWLSRELLLSTWDKPAAACLSSRLAYGVPVTTAALARIERAETALGHLGLFGQVRVRDQGNDLARIETSIESFEGLLGRREDVVEALRAAGFLFVTLDLEGYRQGSHNRVLLHGLQTSPPGPQAGTSSG